MAKFSNISREADLTPELRKQDHIELALSGKASALAQDQRFDYEPLIAATPKAWEPFTFLGKTFKAPLWVSSMTGGTQNAGEINRRLATVAGKYGFGMGLGSCRSLLYGSEHLPDFTLRKYIGDAMPLYANLGIAQVGYLVNNAQWSKLADLIKMTEADGLIIHINPVQEWLQQGGDTIEKAPLDTIRRVLDKVDFPVIIKEVGQGFGPASLEALLDLPLQAIEFAALGGTNFGAIEQLRCSAQNEKELSPLVHIGHTAAEMAANIHAILETKKTACGEFIISGGIRNFLDGYYCMQLLNAPAVIGQASSMLRHALEGEAALSSYVDEQLRGLAFARTYLKIKKQA